MNYNYTHYIIFSEKYKFNSKKELINTNTGNKIKKVYNNGSLGYNIDRKFMSLTYLRQNIRTINEFKKEDTSKELERILNQLKCTIKYKQ